MARTKEIVSVQPYSVAKTLGAVFAVIGIVVSILMLALLFVGSMQSGNGGPANMLILVLVVPPLLAAIYALAGYICGLVGAYAYNAVAKWAGGIKIELQ